MKDEPPMSFTNQSKEPAKVISQPSPASYVDAEKLARRLKRNLKGEVRFDDGSRALYATDGSNYRQVPIGVVLPKDKEDVVATVAECRRMGAPLLSRGGGTSLAGQCCNVAVVMDFSKYMHDVLEIDTVRKLGRVQPGCVLDTLRNDATKLGLNFGPDPATHNHCTLGGMLGNNSCGTHSLLCRDEGLGLRTSDNTHELEILTYDGLRMRVGETSPEQIERFIREGGRQAEIYAQLKGLRDKYANLIRARFPKLPRRVSGYNLDELLPENGFNLARALVGTESTCVTILEASLRLVSNPGARSLLVLGYKDVFSAADHLMEILEFKPAALEGMDDLLFQWVQQKGDKNADIKLLPQGGGWLMVEFGGDSKKDSDEQARRCAEMLKKQKDAPNIKLYDNPEQEEMIWKVREGGLGSTAWVPGHRDTWEGFEDSAVPPHNVPAYLRDFKKLLDSYDYDTSLYGHFGQGCIHCRIPFDLYTAEGIRKFESFLEKGCELVMKYGGVMSGEHGDGQSRGQFLPKMFGEELMEAFREFKRIWDPEWKMNPGKVIDAYKVTENLRLGTDYDPPNPTTYFQYPADRHTFSRAALRCVGIGECRRHSDQVMCPSYQVTMEEKHSTRGRARLLWEMLNGGLLKKGWKNEAVKEALDLCLACKGCKHDCPVNVDMATYKAEFLSHYYKHKLRPRHAYAFGFIHVWTRLGSIMPGIPNFITHAPVLGKIAKWIVGMQQTREVPAMARESFKAWFKNRPLKNLDRPPVVLWPDTFNNYYHPDVAKAAVEVLEDAGFRVQVPTNDMCCGRPLYDYGFLDKAKKWLQDILEIMRVDIRNGIPFIVLEPSCCAVFRDELANLFPNDEDAKKLHQQTFVLSEFLVHHAPGYPHKQITSRAIVHAHCHHRSVIGFREEETLLKRVGLDFQIPEPGCCGMAGAFGFERGDHYDVSIKCGERSLLPAVRHSSEDTLIIADGFSCHEQIVQRSNRKPLHIAQVLQMAIHEGEIKPVEPAQSMALVKIPPSDGQHEEKEHGYLHNRVKQWTSSVEEWLGKHKKPKDDRH
ncbi:FAD-binding and (Fe-S)-binding domain-containing protein [Pedosphaera parvula]|uniref:FAD-binding and (Fe-S)-binding domain-containing protein n=1 Tax=Pedosphaera parvula TaxID=1032527 RepID=UPI00192A88BF|nr:FAD-binding and (Fe-S)-binding domain-containing protein [Pedosphaera parvula]